MLILSVCWIINVVVYIIEYGSTLYVGMVQGKNGCQCKQMASACSRTHTNISLEVSNMHGNAYWIDLWSKMERTLMQSFLEVLVNMGRKSDFLLSSSSSFFSRPSATTLEATMIIFTRNSSILSRAVHWLFLFSLYSTVTRVLSIRATVSPTTIQTPFHCALCINHTPQNNVMCGRGSRSASVSAWLGLCSVLTTISVHVHPLPTTLAWNCTEKMTDTSE